MVPVASNRNHLSACDPRSAVAVQHATQGPTLLCGSAPLTRHCHLAVSFLIASCPSCALPNGARLAPQPSPRRHCGRSGPIVTHHKGPVVFLFRRNRFLPGATPLSTPEAGPNVASGGVSLRTQEGKKVALGLEGDVRTNSRHGQANQDE